MRANWVPIRKGRRRLVECGLAGWPIGWLKGRQGCAIFSEDCDWIQTSCESGSATYATEPQFWLKAPFSLFRSAENPRLNFNSCRAGTGRMKPRYAAFSHIHSNSDDPPACCFVPVRCVCSSIRARIATSRSLFQQRLSNFGGICIMTIGSTRAAIGCATLEDSKGANFIILLGAAACNLQTRTASS